MYYRDENSTLIKCQRGLLEKQQVQLHCDCMKGVQREGVSGAHGTQTHAFCSEGWPAHVLLPRETLNVER